MQILEFIIDDMISKYLYSDNKMFTLIFSAFSHVIKEIHLKVYFIVILSFHINH